LQSGINSQTQYDDEQFIEVNLERTRVVSSEFHDCIFTDCAFVESILEDCVFINCTFRRCDLSLIQVPGGRFAGTRFEECKMIGINWTQADWSGTRLSSPISFSKSILNHSTFIGLNLSKMQMKGCTAVNVDFREANLTLADFANSDLSDSLFTSTNLTKADFRGTRNYRINPAENTITRARFSLPEAMSLLYSMDIDLTGYDLTPPAESRD